jgi:hypothetical protein
MRLMSTKNDCSLTNMHSGRCLTYEIYKEKHGECPRLALEKVVVQEWELGKLGFPYDEHSKEDDADNEWSNEALVPPRISCTAEANRDKEENQASVE